MGKAFWIGFAVTFVLGAIAWIGLYAQAYFYFLR
jgi:hypothetical protein